MSDIRILINTYIDQDLTIFYTPPLEDHEFYTRNFIDSQQNSNWLSHDFFGFYKIINPLSSVPQNNINKHLEIKQNK